MECSQDFLVEVFWLCVSVLNFLLDSPPLCSQVRLANFIREYFVELASQWGRNYVFSLITEEPPLFQRLDNCGTGCCRTNGAMFLPAFLIF